MTDRPHNLTTTYANDGVQHNTCHVCGAHTEGPMLPDLPCLGGSEGTREVVERMRDDAAAHGDHQGAADLDALLRGPA